MTDAQILEVIRELGGATTSGDWVMRFGRAIAGRASNAAEPAGGARRWLSLVQEQAAHVKANAQALRKFPGTEPEARARELAAQYLVEVATCLAMEESHREIVAAIAPAGKAVPAGLSDAQTGIVRFDLPAEDCFTNDTGPYPMYHCMDCKASEYGTTKVEHKPGCRVAAALAASAPGAKGEK